MATLVGFGIPWQKVPPHEGERIRWESADGRWVALVRGQGDDKGKLLVKDSSGRCEVVHNGEAALELARRWRGAGKTK